MSEKFTLCAFADEADLTLTGQIAALNENDIVLLEIRGVDGENISQVSKSKAKEVKNQLDDSGIKVWSIGSPSGKIGIADDFTPHLEQFKHMLELTDIFNASRYRLFSFYGVRSAAERDCATERLERFVSEAKGSGVTLCHENEKDIYGETADACFDIHINIPSIKAVFDPANFVQSGQDPWDAWKKLSQYVDYIHIKDALKDGQVVPAGQGEGHIPEILAACENSGGRVLTLEPHLSEFVGLSALENGQTMEKMQSYPSQRVAFDAAVNALKNLIK